MDEARGEVALAESREELEARLRLMERALSAIEQETQHAMHHPETCMTTLCRIATSLRNSHGCDVAMTR